MGIARHIPALFAAAAIVACAGPLPGTGGREDAPCGEARAAGDGTRLALIRQVLEEGKPYAALAQLDAIGLKGPDVDYLRAEALRRTGGDDEAAAIYRSLLGTCLKGQGHHGLGLVEAHAGRLQESLAELKLARQALPADPRVRNDLGYALLMVGDLGPARFEFLTALDLDPADRKAAANLVQLLFRAGERDKAESIAARYKLDADTVESLRRQASAAPAAATDH